MATTLPPAGARLQLGILLPKLHDSGPGVRLCGEGVVLRCLGGGESAGFAASVQFYPEPPDEVVLSSFRSSRRVQ